ncbi:MAG: choice-of-anchor J domain-containing protein [Muribaculaceae bacterium]|nr:choice-of-anchor J domain-containing protein [Muribaculaceae bacterium]
MKPSIALLTSAVLIAGVSAELGARHKRGQFNPEKANREFIKNSPGDASVISKPIQQVRILPICASSPFTLKEIESPSKRPGKSPAKVMGDGTMIYGSMLYSNTWAGTTGSYGIYSFPASDYTAPELVYAQGGYEANGGGCYHDGKYYWNSFVYTDEMGYTFNTFCTYDFKTQQVTKQIQSFINETFDLQQITNALTYDVTTDKIYALGNIKITDESGYFAKYYPSLSEIDSYSGFATPIAQIPAMVTLAANPAGELYAISLGKDSKLYSINKTTGDCIEIGSTGIDTGFAQSMAFDPVTGKLYWAAVTDRGATGLYEVNVATGEASRILTFENNEEYTGLYIPAPEVNASAPGVCEISTNFTNGSLTGSVTVTAPEKTYSDTPLSGNFTVTLLTDGGNKEEFTLAAGTSKTVARELNEGSHNFTAWASNADGDGPRRAVAAFVGIDAPAAVTNLKLIANESGDAVISWEAPAIGRHDGWIDPTQLTYTITRYPDEVNVASGIKTSGYTDIVEAKADNYWYVVTPWCGNREGVSSSTESGLFGGGSALPCLFSMETKEDFNLFTIIDANQDWNAQYNWGGWMYGPDFKYTYEEDGICAVYGYSPESAADDWLITPPVQLEKGKKYRLTFTMWTRGDKEKLTVTAGSKNTIEAQKVIIPTKEYNHKDHQVFTQDFVADADGNNFIGFHITSDKKRFYLFIADIQVDAVPDEDSPEAVSNLAATPDNSGANSVTLSFNAPVNSVAGTPLSSLEKIEIYHGNELIPVKVFDKPACGSSLSWTENYVDGWMNYRVVPFANGKAGKKAEVKVFVGWDIPLIVTDLEVSDATGHPVVTWTAPTNGENGGFINPSELTYNIYRYEDDFELLAKDVKGLTFTDTELDGSTIQHLVAYVVTAKSPAGLGEAAATDYIVYGEPYTGTFLETFEDASVHYTPWVLTKVKGKAQNWGVTSIGSSPYCIPVGNDGGMAVYSNGGYNNDEGRMISPKLSIKEMNSPGLSFYLYHNYTDEHAAWDEGFLDALIPEIMLPDGSFVALDDPIRVDDLGTGWLKYSYSLSEYRNQPYIRVSLHGITDCEQNVYVDHIQVANIVENDLQAYTFSGPSKIEAGKNANYKFTIFNYGANEINGSQYNVKIYADGNLFKTLPGKKIASKEYLPFEFEVTYSKEDVGSVRKYYAEIEFSADEMSSNNRSETIGTTVVEPRLAEISSVEADSSQCDVTITWGKPDSFIMNDGFEDYAAFGIDNFGEYTLHDLDGNRTYAFQDIYFENSGEPMAFMVFNPVTLGIVSPASSLFPYDCFDPHNGKQVLASIQGFGISSTGSATVATNDDWFISPEIFGGQTISFFAKSGDVMQGIDKYQVLYSSTDNNPGSFTALTSTVSTGAEWEECSVALPQDAKYFAIRCVSEDGFILMIDDLQFIAKAPAGLYNHVGYRLYRNGAAIGDFPVDAKNYVDRGLANGQYEYNVSALYEGNRESKRSRSVFVTIGDSGIADNLNSAISVSTHKGILYVTSQSDINVEVFAADGKMVYAGHGLSHKVALSSGVYLVKTNESVTKILI